MITQRELFEAAREAGLSYSAGSVKHQSLMTFARLIARVEREAVLKACALEGITIKDIIRMTQERDKA